VRRKKEKRQRQQQNKAKSFHVRTSTGHAPPALRDRSVPAVLAWKIHGIIMPQPIPIRRFKIEFFAGSVTLHLKSHENFFSHGYDHLVTLFIPR
jgi:hypothetical protein